MTLDSTVASKVGRSRLQDGGPAANTNTEKTQLFESHGSDMERGYNMGDGGLHALRCEDTVATGSQPLEHGIGLQCIALI